MEKLVEIYLRAGSTQLFAQHAEHEARHRLIKLEQDIAGKAISHQHVARALEDIATLDVTHAMQIAFSQELMRSNCKLIAFLGLLTNVQQTYARCIAIENILRIDRTEPCELQQMMWLAVYVRARINEQSGRAGGRQNCRHRRTVD